jgi:hypothetical protein
MDFGIDIDNVAMIRQTRLSMNAMSGIIDDHVSIVYVATAPSHTVRSNIISDATLTENSAV